MYLSQFIDAEYITTTTTIIIIIAIIKIMEIFPKNN